MASSVHHLQAELESLRAENRRLTAALAHQRFVRTEVTPEEVDAMRGIFSAFDSNGDSYIDLAELRTLHERLGEPLSEAEVAKVMDSIHPAEGDRLTFDEFLHWWRETHSNKARYGERFKLLRTTTEPLQLSLVHTEARGQPGTLEYRVFFMHGDREISPWHDVTLHSTSNETGPFNMIVEIPKWTRHKFEIATGEVHNPIKQDSKNAVLRDYKWGDMMFNYGAFPQTWEDPHHITDDTGFKGDNDPLDALEIGTKQRAVGEIVPVKPLGVLALIDDGETDWKVITIADDDPLSKQVHDIGDLEHVIPGAVHAIREFFRVYKLAEAKPLNQFGFDGECKNREYALGVIAETHAFWKALQRRNQTEV